MKGGRNRVPPLFNNTTFLKEAMMADKRVVLAEGEATGHAHVAEGPGLTFVDERLTVPESAELTHEEHATRTIPKGDFEVRRVVELDPSGDVREVAD
jgi:hypothetical protein